MPCCGQTRRALRSPHPPAIDAPVFDPAADQRPWPPPASGTAEFEYLGDRVLAVMGQATRRLYRFVGRGARVAADGRDRASLVLVPGLREVQE